MVTPMQGAVLLSPDEIRPSPDNPRKTIEGIEDLAASINQIGLLQPIVVQRVAHPGERPYFEIVAGHRRFAALRMLAKREIPAIVRRPVPAADLLLARIAENDQRAALDPIEEALAIRQMQLQRDPALTNAEVGVKLGRSINYISRRLALLELSVEEQEKVRAGHYSVSYAVGLVRETREASRRPTDARRGRPKGVTTAPHFGEDHPLADDARIRCGRLQHRGVPKLGNAANGRGGGACGPCWEYVIRADERENPTEASTDLDESGATA